MKARFVDTMEYSNENTFAVVVADSSGKTCYSASIPTSNPEVAEQAAIALAMLDGLGFEIHSDSKAADRAFQSVASPSKLLFLDDRVRMVSRIIRLTVSCLRTVEGAPPHLNEFAHEAAHESATVHAL